MGRFQSLDPLAADYASWSPYNYVLGNPIIFIDPTGLGPEDTDPPIKAGDEICLDDGTTCTASADEVVFVDPGAVSPPTPTSGEVALEANMFKLSGGFGPGISESSTIISIPPNIKDFNAGKTITINSIDATFGSPSVSSAGMTGVLFVKSLNNDIAKTMVETSTISVSGGVGTPVGAGYQVNTMYGSNVNGFLAGPAIAPSIPGLPAMPSFNVSGYNIMKEGGTKPMTRPDSLKQYQNQVSDGNPHGCQMIQEFLNR